MTLIVRVVRGQWRKQSDGTWDHEAALNTFNYSITLKEGDTFPAMEGAIRVGLNLGPRVEMDITYQWPHWMLGHDWKKSPPIYVLDDDDASLFLAIRADLHEVFLRVRVRECSHEKNVNSIGGVMDLNANWGNIKDLDNSVTRYGKVIQLTKTPTYKLTACESGGPSSTNISKGVVPKKYCNLGEVGGCRVMDCNPIDGVIRGGDNAVSGFGALTLLSRKTPKELPAGLRHGESSSAKGKGKVTEEKTYCGDNMGGLGPVEEAV